MKVYRCLTKVEKELFQMNYICSRRGNEKEREVNINTHNYGNIEIKCVEDKIKSERIHFFLFLEDALKYVQEYQQEDEFCSIGEYEIPDNLVIDNIGCGFYIDMNVPFILETAIPYANLIKDTDDEAYNVYEKGAFGCDIPTLTNYLSRIRIIREKIETDELLVPTHTASCNYCKKIICDDIELNTNYENFIQNYGIVDVLKALNIKIIMQNCLFDKFDISDKKIDYEKLSNVLKEYGLLEKNKTYQKK